jgi:aspartate carbamoyltransferase catalytic subunit
LKQPIILKKVINRPIKKVPSLRDITIANIFSKIVLEQNSLELAQNVYLLMLQFSAQSSVKKGETLIDTVNNILDES